MSAPSSGATLLRPMSVYPSFWFNRNYGRHLDLSCSLVSRAMSETPPQQPSLPPRLDTTPLTVQTSQSTENPPKMLATLDPDNGDPLLFRIPGLPAAHVHAQRVLPLSPSTSHADKAWIPMLGFRLPCLVYGGEPRVPLFVLYSTIFPKQQMQVEEIIEDLNINVHLIHQGEKLFTELGGMIPLNMRKSVAMITRTDVERIAAKNRKESQMSKIDFSKLNVSERFPVFHCMNEDPVCGWAYPSRRGGRSILCRTCEHWFRPEHFPLHNHSDNKENRVVHWGFEAENWHWMVVLEEPAASCPQALEEWAAFCSTVRTASTFKRSMDEEPDMTVAVPAKVAPKKEEEEEEEFPKPGQTICLDNKLYKLADLVVNILPMMDPTLVTDLAKKEKAFQKKAMAEAARGLLPGFDPADPSTSAKNAIQTAQANLPSPLIFPEMGQNYAGIDRHNRLQYHLDEMEKLVGHDNNAMLMMAAMREDIQTNHNATQDMMKVYNECREAYKLLSFIFRLQYAPLSATSPTKLKAIKQVVPNPSCVAGPSRVQVNPGKADPPPAFFGHINPSLVPGMEQFVKQNQSISNKIIQMQQLNPLQTMQALFINQMNANQQQQFPNARPNPGSMPPPS